MAHDPLTKTPTLCVELDRIVDRLLSLLGSADSTRAHVIENFALDRELLRRIDSTCVAARDALLLVTRLQLWNRDRIEGAPPSSGVAGPPASQDDEARSRPTVRVPRSR